MDAEFLKVTLLTTSTGRRVIIAQCRGMGEEGDDDGAEPFDDVEILYPLGFIAKPALTPTTEVIGFRRGDEIVALPPIDKGQSAVNVETGETRVQGCGASNQSAVIRVRASGAIEITSTGSGAITVTSAGAVNINSATGTNINVTAGTNIVLNGGNKQVARATDPVGINGTLATWITQVTAAVNGLAPGSVTAVPGSTVGTITTGALTVLA